VHESAWSSIGLLAAGAVHRAALDCRPREVVRMFEELVPPF